MPQTIDAKHFIRRGTVAQWTSANPVLASGEMGYETDTKILRIGDGATAFMSLGRYAEYDDVIAARDAALAAATPTGGIIMWSGAADAVPVGWALCNGTSGTPDLRNRFIVGAGGAYAVGATGGADAVQLTEAQMPSHQHGGSTTVNGEHVHGTQSYIVSGGGIAFGGSGGFLGSGSGTFPAGNHSHGITTDHRGGNQSHENRPPYYALAYIMKV